MLVIDIEGSGTNYDKHSIVSLGALDLHNPDNRIYLECQIWDGAYPTIGTCYEQRLSAQVWIGT